MEPFLPGQGKPEAQEGKLNLYKARLHEDLPFIVNPLTTLRGKDFKAFHVRHEASMLELFFDLCFVANLATFTSYHEITTSDTVFAYMGFFMILWSTWFQVTIFDVRFASDSVYERCCKLYQFMAFVIFAVGGTYFAPGEPGSEDAYRIYQIISVVLGITRVFLATQYLVVACFVVPKYRKLWLPFTLIITTYVISGAILLLMFKFFNPYSVSRAYIGWWIILPIEAIGILTISSIWRELSFKESHINERLFLLTLIIIGEGVIGLTKIVGKLWPSDDTPKGGVIVVLLSVMTMLFLLWQTYFDCHPHGHYGTIKQQWWAMSHFFLHLGYVGVVEGSNRMAVFYYATSTILDVLAKMKSLCNGKTSDFIKKMNATLETYKVENYFPVEYYEIQGIFNDVKTSTTFCANKNSDEWFDTIFYAIRDSIMAKLDIEPAESDPDSYFFHTFRVTYAYFLGSVALTLITAVAFLYIVRRQYHDRFEFFRMGWRLLMGLIAVAMIFLYYNATSFLLVIASPYIDLVVCTLMASTLVVDRICRFLGLSYFRKRYAVPPPEPKSHHRDSVATTLGAESYNLQNVPSRPDSYVQTSDSNDAPGRSTRPRYMSVGSEDATMLAGSYGPDLGTPGYGPGLSTPAYGPGDGAPNYMQHTEYPRTYGAFGDGYYDPTR